MDEINNHEDTADQILQRIQEYLAQMRESVAAHEKPVWGEPGSRQQHVLIATNHHDVGGGPDEQWVTIQSAGAFLLSQYMTWAKTPPGGMSQQDYVKLNDLLWTFCAALRWSKWDYRSTWYIKDVKPLQEQCDKCEGA